MTNSSTDAVQLSYRQSGKGAPLILITGFAAGAWIWFRQADSLSQSFRVITFDPPGIGRSEFLERPPQMHLLADDIANLLRGLQIERAHILGASFGGFVSQEFALGYPELTRSLTLCCTSFGGPNHVLPAAEVMVALASMSDFNTEERVRRNLIPAFSPDFLRDRPDVLQQVIELRMANPVDERAFRWQMTAAMSFNAEALVGEITAPTLVIAGDADQIVPPENSRNLAAKIPRAELKMIAGGGHLFFIEQADEFNSAVTKFLNRN
jgi:pimeloyl-ACP methyl ester carboxylesterase